MKRFPIPRDVEARWLLRVEKSGHDGCWRWMGSRWARGYGRFLLPGGQKRVAAHRWGYEHFIGPVPPGLELDHLCRHPWCVNPSHLEPVTHRLNVVRGDAAKVNGSRQRSVTHCPRGHEYDTANTYYRPNRPGRNCRACGAIVTARRKAEARVAA